MSMSQQLNIHYSIESVFKWFGNFHLKSRKGEMFYYTMCFSDVLDLITQVMPFIMIEDIFDLKCKMYLKENQTEIPTSSLWKFYCNNFLKYVLHW